MFQPVDTRKPDAVEKQVQAICRHMFPGDDSEFVSRSFAWGGQCFAGRYGDYQSIDAQYHDFEHTLQGTLGLARLLQGRHRCQVRPELTLPMFELGLLAILFHDTGYLKKRGDREGTGAKYTPIHVARSAVFAQEFLQAQNYPAPAILAVQNMIRCTGVSADFQAIPFQNELEQILGFALATADLLGQMAAPDYVEKLPILFLEFAEAAQSGYEQAARFAAYVSAEDLMRKTPGFWEQYVRPRIDEEFQGLYRFLNDPYPDGPNAYIQGIEENIARLQRKLAAAPPQ